MSLITKISELQQYISIDGNTKWNTIKPFIEEAEQNYLLPLLGQAFYDYYHPLYKAMIDPPNTPLSANNAKLLPYIQRCLAYYAQLHAIPHLASTFGELGVRQHRADDSDAAPRWLIEKLQFHALKHGDMYADRLLEFLEKNASNVVGNYEQWYNNAEVNTKMSGFIVYGTSIASKHIDINNSRRVYLQIRNKIREIETRIIPKLIGTDQYDALVTQIQTNALTNANKDLIAKLEPVISKRALYLQLPFMRVQINENGIFVYSGTDSLVALGQLATDADIKILRAQLMDEKELGYLADEHELRQFILDNIEDYPLIKASGVYTTTGIVNTSPRWNSINDPDSKYFAP